MGYHGPNISQTTVFLNTIDCAIQVAILLYLSGSCTILHNQVINLNKIKSGIL